jgi:biopolymer transport protein ExbB/TolQ
MVAAFVALNMEEFTRISTLSLGFATVQVSLGLVMLVALAAATVIFLASALYMQSTNLLEMRKHTKELNSQRELADKAEASRFTELQNFLATQAATQQQRQADADAALAESFERQQQALMARIEQSDNTLAAYIGQLQDKLERTVPMSST